MNKKNDNQFCTQRYNSKFAKKLEVCNHVPTLRCHEDIMKEHAPFHSRDECVLKANKCVNHIKKYRPKKEECAKAKQQKLKNVYESVSAPVETRSKNLPVKTTRTKSISQFSSRPTNLEDSVDFFPVKLSSNYDMEEKSENSSKPRRCNKPSLEEKQLNKPIFRATWDQLLKNGVSSAEELKLKLDLEQNNYTKKNDKLTYLKLDEHLQNHNLENIDPRTSKNGHCHRESSDDNEEIMFLKSTSVGPTSSRSRSNLHLESCPLKTLDFHIKQLRKKLSKKSENNHINQIISDMEDILMKISTDNQSSLYNAPEKKVSENIESPTLMSVPKQLSDKSSVTENIKNNQMDVAQLQKGLEESCKFLQSLCIKDKENCNKHIREKEQLTLQLAESRRLLAIAKSKEKDYEVQIGELRLKIQEAEFKKDPQSHSVEELKDTIAKLKSENEILNYYKDAVKKTNTQLKETAREKEMLQAKLYLKELEIEKLKVLLDIKDNFRPGSNHDKHAIVKSGSAMSLCSLNSSGPERAVMCSSQASSLPRHSPTPSNSWLHISSICQKPSAASEINRGIADIFQTLKTKTNQNEPPNLDLELASSNNSLWSNKEDDVISKSDGYDLDSLL